ncbi:MAG: phosphate ABC transporter substrate-binding protein [Lysobacteraceae bacterium]
MKRILSIAALALLTASPAFAGKVVVAANSSQGTLDKAGVQAIVLGRTAQVGGQPAVVVFQKGPVRAPFESGVVGRAGAQLASHWSRLVFTGRAKAPEDLADDAAVKAKVASTPGAIGYISDGAVDGTVKVLFDF